MNTTFKIIIAVIITVLSFAIIQRIITPEYIIKENVVTIEDYSKIDSLTKVIEYLEEIPPDTVIIKINIPTPILTDSSYKYKFPYADSNLVALWTVETLGEIVDAEFEYFQRRRLVRELQTTITEHHYLTKLKTVTKTESNKAYLSLGGELELFNKEIYFYPKVSYTLKSGESFSVKYDIINRDKIAVSYTRPIRFKLPF